MGIISFLTASKLKTENGRQHGEIARLRRAIEQEINYKLEAKTQVEEEAAKTAALSQQCQALSRQLKEAQEEFAQKYRALQKDLDQERRQQDDSIERTLAARKEFEASALETRNLKKEYEELNRQFGAFQRQADEQDRTLRDQLLTEQRQRQALDERYSQVDERNEALTAQVDDLEAQRNQLAQDLQQTQSHLDRFQQRKQVLEEDMERMVGKLFR
ncbi:MAG: hypothetical protein GKR89_15240 [Candidatus Latescibacteria bacterium]|nr:hypothetical protein [Candidatus Latescibacterota bacterium]